MTGSSDNELGEGRAEKTRVAYLLSGTAATVFGLFVMVGWFTGTKALVQLFKDSPSSVQFTTGVLFVCSGLGLAALYVQKKKVAIAAAVFVMLIAVLTFSFYAADSSWNIDLLFSELFENLAPWNKIHVAPNTSICFILVGISLLLLTDFDKHPRRSILIGVVGACLTAIAGVAFAGYLFKLDIAYGWFGQAKMAASTSIAFLLLGFVIMSMSWEKLVSDENNGNLAWFAVPLCICLLAITWCVWEATRYEQNLYIEDLEKAEIDNIEGDLSNFIHTGIMENQALATTWKIHKGTPHAEWAASVDLYLSEMDALKAVEWIDSSYQVRWNQGSTAFSLQGGLPDNQQELLHMMHRSQQGNITKVGKLNDADNVAVGLVIITPLYSDSRFDGFVAAYYDLKMVFQRILYDQNAPKFNILFYTGPHLVYNFTGNVQAPLRPEELYVNRGVERDLWYDEVHFKVKVIAKKKYITPPLENLPLTVLIVGFLIMLLISGIVYYAHAAREKTKGLVSTVAQLHQMQNCLINQEKLASLGALVAGIAHEIKNPLNFIQNFSELSLGLSQEIRDVLEKHESAMAPDEKKEIQDNFKTLQANLKCINEQGQRAGNTIQRMLSHARAKTEDAVETDLHSLLDEYLKLSYQGARSRDPNFYVKIEKNYANPYGRLKVHPEDMSRVFLNLFNNAYYALSAKRKALGDVFVPVISVKTEDKEDRFEIHIRDNGGGIPEEVKQNLFKPFFTTKPSSEGTGLGLTLSRNIIVEEHGGSLNFESKEGKFTEFIITLPTKK